MKLSSEAEQNLEIAEVLPGDDYHKQGGGVIREILQKGSIPMRTLRCLVGVKVKGKLLNSNVLAIRINSREITFQSQLMKRYCEENSAIWEDKE